jgi:CRISPR-associated protein Csh1
MLNVIADIGKIVSGNSQGDLLEFLIPEATRQRYIVGINFDLAKSSLAFKLMAEGSENGLSKQKLQEFLFVASERGNRPQFSPTSSNLGYLVSQTLPNLADFLPEGSELKKLLQKVRDRFFMEVQEKGGKKSAFILNAKFIPDASFGFEKKPEKLKDAIGDYAKELAKLIEERTTAPARETIYTLCVNDDPVADHPDYQRFLWQQNSESAFEGGFAGTCSICGTETQVTPDTTRFVMKFYMTDKVSFASHFDEKNYYKAVTACKSCYQNIIIAEKWIHQHLRTRLGGFDVYVMPQMIWTEMEGIRLFRYLQAITREFNEIKNIQSLRNAQINVQARAERMEVFKQNAFIWNFLFFRKSQSAFKVLSLIKDVPPSRIMEITEHTNGVDACRKKLQISDNVVFDLDQIYWLIPLRKRGADLLEYKKLLQLYACIFNGLPVHKEQLYNFYKQLACMHHFGSYGLYQFKKPNNPDFATYALMADTLKWNLFLLFLQKLNLIEGESTMNTNEFDDYFPDGVKEAFTELGYNAAQQGLALLGYVIGVIAYAQYKEGLENKPVLEKINYQGMSEEKIVRLFNDAFEKIRQYRKNKTVSYAERWLALAKKLYETGAHKELTVDERVFYLLSGYSMNLLRSKPTAETAEAEETEPVEEESA